MRSWPGRAGLLSSAAQRKLPGKLQKQLPYASARLLRLQLQLQVTALACLRC